VTGRTARARPTIGVRSPVVTGRTARALPTIGVRSPVVTGRTARAPPTTAAVGLLPRDQRTVPIVRPQMLGPQCLREADLAPTTEDAGSRIGRAIPTVAHPRPAHVPPAEWVAGGRPRIGFGATGPGLKQILAAT